MVEKVGYIKNPLTVIAIFAGLAEVGGTVVLPSTEASIQHTYVWFLMLFPVMLVTFFFITLLLKHHVFYAPTDYRSDESFTGLLIDVTGTKRLAKLDEEANEVQAASSRAVDPASATIVGLPAGAPIERRAVALFAEELAVTALSEELGVRLQRNVAFATAPNVILDGVASLPGRTVVVEVKYTRTSLTPANLTKTIFERMRSVYETLPKQMQKQFEVILVIVTEGDTIHDSSEIRAVIARLTESYPFKTSVRVFDLRSLNSQIERSGSSEGEDSLQRLENRIVGLLGAGRSLNRHEIMSQLKIDEEDTASVAIAQEAIGRLVKGGKIGHDSGSIEDYCLKRNI